MVNIMLSKLCLFSAALLIAGVSFAHGQHTDHAHAMHGHSPNTEVALGSSAAFDRDGVLWAVSKEGAYVAIRSSRDFGRSWSAPRHVNAEPEGVEARGDARPRIAVGVQGELYVTWTKPLAKPYTGNIRFSRSLDHGHSFSKPLTVNADRQEITHRFDAIAVTPAGEVFVAWIDKRDSLRAVGSKPEYAGAAVYYAVSDDRGATFHRDRKLADHSCECCRIALLPVGSDRVLAFWRHVFPPNIRDHALAAISARGVLMTRRATFDDWRSDVCPHHGPALAVDGSGQLHAVWFTQGKNGAGVFYGRLGEGRVDGRRRVGGATAEHADIAANGRSIAIAWKEFDGERSQLKTMLSQDGGSTWRDYRLMSTDGPSDQPRLLQYGGSFYVFWNTQREPFSMHRIPQ